MNNVKEIAEKILNCIKTDIKSYRRYASAGVEIEYLALRAPELARAYLDAAKELETTKAALSELENKHEYIHNKLLDDIEYQKSEISILKQDLDSEKRNHKIFREAAEGYLKKLKKSREVLRTAVEFYGNWVNSPDGIIHRSDCETIFVHEPLEKDKNGIVVAGKKAREALKADDEVMVVGK